MLSNYEDKQLASIKELEETLENVRLINAKNKFLLELNKGLVNSKKVLPYILATTISFSAFSLFYSIPFVKDTRRQNLWYKKEIDSNGNIAIEEQYKKNDNPSEISYISEWKSLPNGYYVRNITTYNIKALNEEEIENLILNDDISLNKILGDPISKKIEKKNNVSEEELNKEGFIRAILYNEELDKYIYAEETISENNQGTIIFLLLTFALNGIYYAYITNVGNDRIRKQLNDLSEKYAPLDEECLKRKLEIRKDTLKRMK